ncbi:helix-turn-helix domain containing protein [uncultured Sulfitobacter sp.]|uniref:helix-turn-helix domain containing protein n=1 Tax=uncultured Sulfitobacter sp. TaxID=191468 RepID=UPI00259A575C|nr:helix-turn-helix domain containing protein [uncultured Sulfitobacter sp.]
MRVQLPQKLTPKPNAQVAPFVEALGEDLAIEFLLKFGGAELYMEGYTQRTYGKAARFLGAENFSRLQAMARRGRPFPKRVPLANPWLATALSCRGESTAEIARRLRVTDTTVRKLIRYGQERMLQGLAP